MIRWRYNTARAAHVGGRSVNRDSCARLRGVCPRRNEEMCFVWYWDRERGVSDRCSHKTNNRRRQSFGSPDIVSIDLLKEWLEELFEVYYLFLPLSSLHRNPSRASDSYSGHYESILDVGCPTNHPYQEIVHGLSSTKSTAHGINENLVKFLSES